MAGSSLEPLETCREELLVEVIGQREANPATDNRIRGAATEGLPRGLVQDGRSGGAQDLHSLDRSVCGDPEAKLHRSLDPFTASGVRIDLILLDLAADAAQDAGTTIATPGTA
jgi:hypothetical protein